MTRKLVALALSALVATLSGCGGTTKGYPLDHEIECVTIYDGARLRPEPYVPSNSGPTNELFRIEMKDHKSFVSTPNWFTVETPDGVAVKVDNNGAWYGIRRADLRSAVAGDLADKLRGDDTSLVWINDDRSKSDCE